MTQYLQVGDSFQNTIRFSQQDVIDFARISGDANPLHLDPDFAATTIFKRPIMHGMLSAAVISKALGMDFPGPGTIYLTQHLEFKAPMFVETDYQLELKILAVVKHRATIETLIRNQEGQITIQGQAQVLNKDRFVPVK